MWLPGDPPQAEETARMLRVDHAGEYGAQRIYQGQLAVVRGETQGTIQKMLEQEEVHLTEFNRLLLERRVRPSLLMPLWHAGGYLLGWLTAKRSVEAAMACTVAVESVIDGHYGEQIARLDDQAREPVLRRTLQRFREEEQEHHDTGLAHGAEQAAQYGLLTAAIRGLTRLSIRLAERI